MAWSPKVGEEAGVLVPWGRLCRERPSHRPCPLLAQTEKCMARGCHHFQRPVWVHVRRASFLLFFFLIVKKMSSFTEKPMVHSYCPSRLSSPTHVPDGNDHLVLFPKLLNSCLPGLALSRVLLIWSHCPVCEISGYGSTPLATSPFYPRAPTSSRSSLSGLFPPCRHPGNLWGLLRI